MSTISVTLDTCPFCGSARIYQRYDFFNHEEFFFCSACKGEVRLKPNKEDN